MNGPPNEIKFEQLFEHLEVYEEIRSQIAWLVDIES